ncbi:MAG: stage V sporulation protein AC [Oscillospiraceae bacterium]|nr:stage V sporulation protein AC [Oscillospiraceae bacterium]
MSTTGKEYDKMAKKASPNSPVFLNCLKAFLIGGLICLFAQVLNYLFKKAGFNDEYVKAMTPSVLIILTAILTGIGIFDKIAKHAGAGTIVPITGFANSVVSPALEFKAEGIILGTGAKIFTVAGPVIAYGTAAAVIYGIIAYIFGLY